jgi:hypothetical protein
MNAPSEHDRGSSATGGSARDGGRKPGALVIGGLGSLALLGVALTLQAQGSSILKLPTQWLAVAALPDLLGLMFGRYIGKFSVGGVGVEAPPLKDAAYVPPGAEPPSGVTAPASRSAWTSRREQEYVSSHWLALVHIYKPSTRLGQQYDISIYITRHIRGSRSNQTTDFADIDHAEFYFGPGWGDRIFTAQNNGGIIGVNTSAWGSFLAICRVTFRDDSQPVVLQRYIDNEMAPA